MRFLAILLILAIAGTIHANKKSNTEAQLKSNTEALRKTQQSIKKAEEKVKELAVKESGFLKSIAEIDNGLTQTREHIFDLQKKENSLWLAVLDIEKEIHFQQQGIDAQKKAIAARVRNLYIHGKREEWELLFNLLKENENPERKLYWVQRLLESDKAVIETYLAAIETQREKKSLLNAKQAELSVLRESKSKEESKLQNQLTYQNELLTKVKKDKSAQEMAISEYKKNQQSLAALIATLEKKRQDEIAAKKKDDDAKKQSQAKGKVSVSKETPVAVGPKCAPLNGPIISNYGYHTNTDLNIKIMHLGTDIRGQKGESVKAAAAGTVVMTANLPGHGPSVILDHKGSYYSVYGHLGSIKVKEGEQVKNCQDIGTVGNAESTNGYKLFFQIYKGTQTQDPIAWLRK